MRKVTRDIMQRLDVDEVTADKVEDIMGQNGLDFSECTWPEFNKAASEAFEELQALGQGTNHDLLDAADDAYGEADFEKVAEHLRVDAGLTDAEVVATGGNIDCVVVHCGTYELFFGTSAEMWGASVYKDDEYKDEEIWTECPSAEKDASKVALAITEAATKFDQAHKK